MKIDMKIYDFSDFLNEEFSKLSYDKLRNSIMEIVNNLKKDETLSIKDLSNKLFTNYNITISPDFLNTIFDEFLKMKRDDLENVKIPIFSKWDSRWLAVKDDKENIKIVRNNTYYITPRLAKYKRELIKEEEEEKLEKEFKETPDRIPINAYIVTKTLVPQRDEDIEKILKIIYKELVFNNRFKNTYENAWKMLITLAKRNKLDLVRGYMEYAPDTVKREYAEKVKYNASLEKIEKKEPQSEENKEDASNSGEENVEN